MWLIILENKSYDATFTGLNQNTYLWKTLPQQGALLKNYFGTGHFSLDNYTSLVSGQGPNPDGQDDCPQYKDAVGSVINQPGSQNNGQWASAAGPNGPVGSNGCVYPADVPTLFNQLDAAHVSWKGYLQDLQNDPRAGGLHLRRTRQPGRRRRRQPGQRHRGRPVRSQALALPVVPLDARLDRLRLQGREPRQRHHRVVP